MVIVQMEIVVRMPVPPGSRGQGGTGTEHGCQAYKVSLHYFHNLSLWWDFPVEGLVRKARDYLGLKP